MSIILRIVDWLTGWTRTIGDEPPRNYGEIPYEAVAHRDHDSCTTMAEYSVFRICYCRDCDDHFKLSKSEASRRTK